MEEETNKEEPGKTPEPEKKAEEEKASESAGSEETAGEAKQSAPPISEEAPYSKTYPRRRLYKSRTNKILFGVCGGLGEYLNIDPIVIRLIFILSFLLGGWGFLVYIIAALIMPGNPSPIPAGGGPEARESNPAGPENSRMILGSTLILLGLYALLRTTGVLRFFNFFGMTHEFILPLILIALGILLVIRHKDFLYKDSPSARRLYRSSTNRMIAGVCAGLGSYLNIDPTLIRIIWVILTFGSFGIGIIIYFLFALLVPLDSEVNLEK